MRKRKFYWDRFNLAVWIRRETGNYSGMKEFSEVIGIPDYILQSWLDGSDDQITKDHVERIARYRDMKPSTIMSWLGIGSSDWEPIKEESVLDKADQPFSPGEKFHGEKMIYRGRLYIRGNAR